jgi:hypothetical protein
LLLRLGHHAVSILHTAAFLLTLPLGIVLLLALPPGTNGKRRLRVGRKWVRGYQCGAHQKRLHQGAHMFGSFLLAAGPKGRSERKHEKPSITEFCKSYDLQCERNLKEYV